MHSAPTQTDAHTQPAHMGVQSFTACKAHLKVREEDDEEVEEAACLVVGACLPLLYEIKRNAHVFTDTRAIRCLKAASEGGRERGGGERQK